MCLWYVWWLIKVILCKHNRKLNFCKYSNMGRGPTDVEPGPTPIFMSLVAIVLSWCWGFMITSMRHTTLSRTPLDEWSAQCRDLYLTTQHSQDTQQLCTPQDLNPQSLHASNHSPTPYIVWPLGSDRCNYMDRLLTVSQFSTLAAKTVMKSETFWAKWWCANIYLRYLPDNVLSYNSELTTWNKLQHRICEKTTWHKSHLTESLYIW